MQTSPAICDLQTSITVCFNKSKPLMNNHATGTENSRPITSTNLTARSITMASHSSQSPNDSDYVGENFKIPTKYLPCVHAANQLDPIAISQMKPETHHRGKRTVARVSAPPGRDGAAVVAVVEDEEGTLARLQLYYQPGDAIMPAGQIVLFGRCYLIKEPFFQVAISGTYGLRVDHLSDILLLPHGHELLPAKWKDSETVAEGSHALRMKGNDAVGKKRWAEAENL